MSPRHRAGTPHGLTTTRTRSKHHPIAALGVAVVLAMAPSAAFADTINGDAGNNVLDGTAGDDTLNGRAGDDTLNGGDGDDTLNGQAGNDTLNGGNGDDTLNGNNGDDELNGDAGSDIIRGGNGDDIIDGGDGDDILFGDEGNDTIEGGAGVDAINGGDGDDTLTGGAGADLINGGAGNDLLCGGDFGDPLERLTGGDGDDLACTVDDAGTGTRDAGSFNLSANDEKLADESGERFSIIYSFLSAIPESFIDGAFDSMTGVFSYSSFATACEASTNNFNFQYSATRGETGLTSIADFNLVINAADTCVTPPVDPTEPPTNPTDPPVDNGNDVDPVGNDVDDNDVSDNGLVAQPVAGGVNGNATLPNAGAGDDLGALVPAGLAAMVVGGVLVAAGRHRKSMV